jgi:hypothetical protein
MSEKTKRFAHAVAVVQASEESKRAGEAFRGLRHAADVKLRALGRHLGIDPLQIHALEQGEAATSVEGWSDLREALRQVPCWLCKESPCTCDPNRCRKCGSLELCSCRRVKQP